MQNLWQRLNAAAGPVGVVVLLIGGGYYLVQGQFDLVTRILVGLGAALVVYAALENPRALLEAVGLRRLRYGGNALVMLLAFVAIVGLVNFLASSRAQRWDLTANRQNSLSDQTTKVLDRLSAPVEVKAFFFGDNPQRREAEDLLKEYAVRSGNIQYEFIDPDLKPTLAQQYNIRYDGTLLFISGDRRQEVSAVSESAFSGALLKLISNQQKKVYFLTGHGERATTDFDRTGFSTASEALQADNYQVEDLTLATTGKVPEDAAVVVIASPLSQLLPEEQEALKEYLKGGGKALVLRDPRSSVSLDDLLKDWGVQIGDGVVVDPQGSLQGDLGTLIVYRYAYNTITEGLRSLTVFPYAGWVQPLTDTQGLRVTPFISSGESSWVETSADQARFDGGQDTRGPVPLAVTVEVDGASSGEGGSPPANPSERTRMAVFGDSDFASNGFIIAEGNRDLFVNTVNWLAESEEQIAIRPKETDDRRVFLNGTQRNLVLFSSIVFLPGIVLAAGAAVWWKRR